MKRTAWPLALSLVLLCPTATLARTVQAPPPRATAPAPPLYTSDRSWDLPAYRPAVASTTFLHTATFDSPGGCVAQGWTAVDLTAQTGEYFHIEDYAGLSFGPVAGAQSLWCGARPAQTPDLCGYATLPGYGDNWNQAWCTTQCVSVAGDLDVSFLMRLDTEAAYDAVLLHYTTDCGGETGWVQLDGGIGVWDGVQNRSVNQAYPVGAAAEVRVRIAFRSDGAWSDEDGLWDTDGAVHIDNLTVEGLPLEDFEDEPAGATASNHWTACNPPGYGVFAGLVSGDGVLQDRDACTMNVSCLWAFFVGSSSDFSCAGHPSQKTVPYQNARNQYFHNEVWSPYIDTGATGEQLIVEFWQYNDFTLDSLVIPQWNVRRIVDGCPEPWLDPAMVFYFQQGWVREVHSVGGFIDTHAATQMQVALGAIDMCRVWCGSFGSGECHSHTPLYDNVRVYRVETHGPQWSIRDADQFQDTFEETAGPAAGRARADMAGDIAPGNHVNSIIPGDSSVVKVSDAVHGLGADPGYGGAAVYCYVSVWPQGQANKTGAHLTPDAARWPVVGSWVDTGGVSWTQVRLDSARVGGEAVADVYCVDLNDNLFESGDTVCFFYAARNGNGIETVAFGSNLALASLDRAEAASDPAEFTVLPAGGVARGGDYLYVDGADGRGAQPYWDTAFMLVGLRGFVDRYDVRGPAAMLSNRPAGRTNNIASLVPFYRTIFWDCADLSVTLGDGTGSPEKTDDYALLNDFLANVMPWGGVYLCGDDVPSQLAASAAASAAAFRSAYLPFSLVAGDHRAGHGISPVASAVAGGIFASDPSFVVYGGCPLLNDFDVMQPGGASLNEITYGPGTPGSDNGALLSHVTGDGRVLLSGFSFIYIRDDDSDGTLDRAAHLHDAHVFLNGTLNPPTGAGGPRATTRLEPNYPNPFNPQTTIAFALARRGAVRLTVYDVGGRHVRTLVDGTRDAGVHRVVWDGRGARGDAVASGVYFCKLDAGDFVQTRKMVLLR